MVKIKKIKAREILDSRGNPTVEVEVELENGIRATAKVPSGASTGSLEALELRDNDSQRYNGKGVLQAVENVNSKIAEIIVGREVNKQMEIDQKMIELDGTENKSNLGANAILGVSLAVCRASALNEDLELYKYIAETYNLQTETYNLPIPMFNILNGGAHADSGLSVQEFKLIPNGIEKYSEQLRAGSEIFHSLKKILSAGGHSIAVGDEGGFAPKLESNTQALELIGEAIDKSGYQIGVDVNLGMDVAANYFYQRETDNYLLQPENKVLSREELIVLYRQWIEKNSIISIEDGLRENDWNGWKMLNEKIGDDVMTIGDDLLVTNVKRLEKAIAENACNSVLIKVNQIGTLTETIECVKLAQKNNMKTIVSHRSGETTDDFIADLAVGVGADFIKTGSLSRGERICKYNRLLRIGG